MVFGPGSDGSYLTTGTVQRPDPSIHHVAPFVTDESRFYLEVVEQDDNPASSQGGYSMQQILAPIASRRQEELEANRVTR